MPVKELKKNNKLASKISEKKIEKFISKGGTLTSHESSEAEHRLTLRFPKSLVARIDKKRKEKLGSISRNLWIIQALDRASR
jgi:hypothetical protein